VAAVVSGSSGLDPTAFVHPSAIVEDGATIGATTKIWHHGHVMSGARIGDGCSFGHACFVAGGAIVGDRVKVQNHVSIYDGVEIEDDVFLGPSCVVTNVKTPRAPVSRRGAYEPTRLGRGCTIGANATIVCGVRVGRFAFVGAGAVVTHDVPDHALVVGNPARRVGWVSRNGHRLSDPDEAGIARCSETGEAYAVNDDACVFRHG
jgi:UDP-2-acetamido-3-amino-2,3-dideoxy-glucuronate N-acetyltransferase